MTQHIYGYFEDTDDFKLTTTKKWERQFKVSGAKKYLENHFLRSLENDFKIAHKAFKRRNDGFFALPRIIFPYITYAGSLYRGKDSAKNAMEFMSDYFGRVAEIYKHTSGIFYIGYRHGLTHTNMPKLFISNCRLYGWKITHAHATNANRGDFIMASKSLIMYPRLFYKDLCRAIRFYIADFDNPRKQVSLFDNFKKGFIEMARIYAVNDIPKDSRIFLRKSLKFLKY